MLVPGNIRDFYAVDRQLDRELISEVGSPLQHQPHAAVSDCLTAELLHSAFPVFRFSAFRISFSPRRIAPTPARFSLMQITTMVGSHCDDTHTAFRTEPPLTKEILECAVTHFFPAGLGDMLSTRDGLLVVGRVGIPSEVVQDYARYLTSAEMKVRKQQATGGTKRQVSLQDRADESGVPLE